MSGAGVPGHGAMPGGRYNLVGSFHMPIEPGARFGPYEIVALLGAGGMGEVYRARDSRLGRDVAVKVLASHVANDPDRLRRFQQEARASGALHHPNVVAVYDIGAEAGAPFVVYELLDGESLRERLRRGRLPESEAVRWAVQIARGLSAAHEKGIIHRDLKPENIFLTADGTVKLLDFGLAKLRVAAVTGVSGPGDATALQTDAAVVMGTVGYMAPEQVRAQPTDHRSDVFAFGVVLYEMLTGARPFEKGSSVETLSAILTDDPPALTDSVPKVAPALTRIVAHCLEKVPDARFQSARDLAFALDALSFSRISGPSEMLREQTVPTARWTSPLWVSGLVALVSLAAGAGAAWWLARPAPEPAAVLRRITFDSGLTTDPAFSSDGKLVAYASDRSGAGNLDIWVQHVAGGEPVRLTQDAADDHQPHFSPDGSKLAFRSERAGGGIYVVPALGGDARLIAAQGRWPRFSPDGSQIAYAGGTSVFNALFVVAASGGIPRSVSEIVGARQPVWSPDGKRLLFLGSDRAGPLQDRHDWWIVAPDDSRAAPIKTQAVPSLATYVRRGDPQASNDPQPFDWVDNRILFSASSGDSRNIWEVALSPASFTVTGPPRRLTMGTEVESQPVWSAPTRRLVFSTRAVNTDVWELPLEANQGRAVGPLRALTQDAAPDKLPNLSSDGRKLIFLSGRLGNDDIWLKDLPSGKEVALTSTPWSEAYAVVARDGLHVIYRSSRQGKRVTHVLATAGGVPRQVCEDCGSPTDWSRDGSTALLQYRINDPQSTLGVLDMNTGTASETLRHPTYNLYRAHFSPDERWVTFHADDPRTGTRVFVAPFRGAAASPPSEWIAVTDGKAWDDAPRWSPDGNLVYYFSDLDGFRCLWAQRLQPITKALVGAPFTVQHLHSAQHSVAAVHVNALDLFVVRDKVVFTMGEVRGNIWMAEYPPK